MEPQLTYSEYFTLLLVEARRREILIESLRHALEDDYSKDEPEIKLS